MIVSHLMEVVVISVLWMLLSWENRKRDKAQSAMSGGLEGRDLDATAFSDMTDRENLSTSRALRTEKGTIMLT